MPGAKSRHCNESKETSASDQSTLKADWALRERYLENGLPRRAGSRPASPSFPRTSSQLARARAAACAGSVSTRSACLPRQRPA